MQKNMVSSIDPEQTHWCEAFFGGTTKILAPWINSPTAQVRENQDYDQESRVLNEAIITNSVRFRSTSPSTYLSIFQQFLKNQRILNLIIHTLRNVKMPRSEKNPVIGFVWK